MITILLPMGPQLSDRVRSQYHAQPGYKDINGRSLTPSGLYLLIFPLPTPSMNKTPTRDKENLLEKLKTLKSDCLASHQAFLDILQQIRDVSIDLHLGSRLQCSIVQLITEWEGYCSVITIQPVPVARVTYDCICRAISASFGDLATSPRQQRDLLEVLPIA